MVGRCLQFSAIVVALVCIHCTADPMAELPPIAKPTGDCSPEFVEFDWPWCAARIPPVENDIEACPTSEIGVSIKREHVCHLVVALKGWFDSLPIIPLDEVPMDVMSYDWERIEWIRICRFGTNRLTGNAQGEMQIDGSRQYETVWTIELDAYIPGFRSFLSLHLDERSGRVVWKGWQGLWPDDILTRR